MAMHGYLCRGFRPLCPAALSTFHPSAVLFSAQQPSISKRPTQDSSFRNRSHSSGSATSPSSSSNYLPRSGAATSDYVTRMFTHTASALMAAGVTPAGISEFASNLSSSSDQEPTCNRCTIAAIPGLIAEELSDVLLSFGAQSVTVQEHRASGAKEQEIFEDGAGGGSQLWDTCDVIAHFALESDIAEVLVVAQDVLELPEPLQAEITPVPNEQWVEQIKASYVPLRITKRLYNVPEWSEPEDLTALNVILVPGVAFGTGEHPTTRMCLELLTELPLEGKTIMDYGAGSGVLAITALKLGASNAVGTDIDSLAVKSARRNAELNHLEDRMQTYLCGAGLDDEEPLAQLGQPGRTFDVVVANILRGPLIELAPRLSAYVRPGGMLVLSGILHEQVPDVREAYGADFEELNERTDGLWACVWAQKRG